MPRLIALGTHDLDGHLAARQPFDDRGRRRRSRPDRARTHRKPNRPFRPATGGASTDPPPHASCVRLTRQAQLTAHARIAQRQRAANAHEESGALPTWARQSLPFLRATRAVSEALDVVRDVRVARSRPVLARRHRSGPAIDHVAALASHGLSISTESGSTQSSPWRTARHSGGRPVLAEVPLRVPAAVSCLVHPRRHAGLESAARSTTSSHEPTSAWAAARRRRFRRWPRAE